MLISEWSSDVFSSDLKGSPMRDAFKWAHIQFGIAIILTMIPRLVACLHGQRPHIVPPPPSWQQWLDHLVQFVLYVRSEERRVGQECVSTCRSRLVLDHEKKK